MQKFKTCWIIYEIFNELKHRQKCMSVCVWSWDLMAVDGFAIFLSNIFFNTVYIDLLSYLW